MGAYSRDMNYFAVQISDNEVLTGTKLESLACLVTADRLLFPELYAPLQDVDLLISGLPDRHRGIIKVFEPFLAPAVYNWDKLRTAAGDLAVFIAGVDYDELLHIPGRFHEVFLARTKTSGKIGTRKKQGSYYTPGYAVKYMVENSLACLLEQSGQNLRDLKALDPACGGASFLLELLRYLLRGGCETKDAVKALYGVDIDGTAVQVSIFILTIAAMAWGTADPALVKGLLEKQIILGNALSAINKTGERGEIAAEFDWLDRFPEVFKAKNSRGPGFDLIVGNPPYVSNKLIAVREKNYYRQYFHTSTGQFDLAVPFLEQGFNLLREGGIVCYITSNKFLASDYGKALRKTILENNRLLELIDVSTTKTFEKTSVYPVIVMLEKSRPDQAFLNKGVKIYDVREWHEMAGAVPAEVNQDIFLLTPDYLITTKINNRFQSIIQKVAGLSGRIPREMIRCGLAVTGFNRWVINGKMGDSELPVSSGAGELTEAAGVRPFIQAGHIKAWAVKGYDLIDTGYFNASRWDREKGPKLVVPGIARQLAAAIDCNECIPGRVYYIREAETQLNLYYLMALLNSFVLGFYYKIMYWPIHLEGGYLRFNSGYLAALPVWDQSWEEEDKKELVKEITRLGELLHGLPAAGKGIGGKGLGIEAQVQTCVFKLYGIKMDEALAIMDYQKAGKKMIQEIIGHMQGGIG